MERHLPTAPGGSQRAAIEHVSTDTCPWTDPSSDKWLHSGRAQCVYALERERHLLGLRRAAGLPLRSATAPLSRVLRCDRGKREHRPVATAAPLGGAVGRSPGQGCMAAGEERDQNQRSEQAVEQ